MNRPLLALLGLVLFWGVAQADLRDTTNAADYLIVTTGELIQAYPWIEDLADWRSTHGRTVMVVATSDIWNEFGQGTPSDTALKDFLLYARAAWQPPQLRDVFIIGWHDVVPSHVVIDSMRVGPPDSATYRRMDYLSDMFYAVPPDSGEPLPVLNIGRLPWSLADSMPLWNHLAKVAAYETAPAAPWQSRIHLIADHSDNQFIFWQHFAESVADMIPPSYTLERDYADFEPPHPWSGQRDEIIANLNAGSRMVFYFGHGGSGQWSGQLWLTAATFDSLQNSPRLPIVSGFSYDAGLNNNLWLGDIARSLMANPEGGAIGYFATTNVAWVAAGLMLRRYRAETAVSDSVTTLGDIWRQHLARYIDDHYDNLGWEIEPFHPVRTSALGCMLLGDPGLVLPAQPASATEREAPAPGEVRLLGNDPNPFNSSTRIAFELDRSVRVRLRVYDVLGREVAVLADGVQPAGRHCLVWHAQGQASGLYLVTLEAAGSRHVRKMMLLK